MKNKLLIALLVFILSLSLMSCSRKKDVTSLYQTPSPVDANVDQTVTTEINAEVPIKTDNIEDYYKIIKVNDNSYTLILYDKYKTVILEADNYPKEPYVNMVDNNLLEIRIHAGNPLDYVFYFDSNTGRISKTYENPKIVGYGKVIYMEPNVLIICDIFNADSFYKEIRRNYSPTAAAASVLIGAKFESEDKLSVQYLVGENYEEKTEIINLDDDPTM